PVADVAGHLAQELGPALAPGVALGLGVLPLDEGDHTLETARVLDLAAEAVLPAHVHLEVVAVQHGEPDILVELLPRGAQREAEVSSEAAQQLLVVAVEALSLARP